MKFRSEFFNEKMIDDNWVDEHVWIKICFVFQKSKIFSVDPSKIDPVQ